MIISEINYLEAVDQETQVVGAGFSDAVKFDKDIHVDKDIKVNIYKDVKSFVFAYGNLAEAEAAANAYGKNTIAETLTVSLSEDYASHALSESTSGTGYSYGYYY